MSLPFTIDHQAMSIGGKLYTHRISFRTKDDPEGSVYKWIKDSGLKVVINTYTDLYHREEKTVIYLPEEGTSLFSLKWS